MPFLYFYFLVTVLLLFVSLSQPYKVVFFKKLTFLFISLIILGLTSLRYRTGTDWPGYEDYFIRNDFSWELGWSYLNYQIKTLGLSVEYVFFIVAIFSLSIKFYIFSKYSKYVLMAVLLSIPFIVNKDFGTIRQGLAIAICFSSTSFIINRKCLKFMVTVLIAAQFHMGAMFFLLAYPLATFNLNKNVILMVTAFCVIFSMLSSVNDILTYVFSNFFGGSRIAYKILKYSTYSDGYDSVYAVSAFDVGTLKKSFNIVLLYFLGAFGERFYRNFDYKVFVNLSLFGYWVFFIFSDINQLRRLVGFFELYEILLFCNFAYMVKSNNLRVAILLYSWLLSLISLYGYTKSYPEYLGHYDSLLRFVL